VYLQDQKIQCKDTLNSLANLRNKSNIYNLMFDQMCKGFATYVATHTKSYQGRVCMFPHLGLTAGELEKWNKSKRELK